jgi:hypothetical protein
LENPVPLDDAPGARVEARLIQWVRNDADETFGGVARQARIRVERDAVAHGRQDGQIAHLRREARVGGAAKQAVELLDLSALSLPTDPRVLAFVPLARAVEQEESVGLLWTEPGIERFDPRSCPLEHRLVAGRINRARVGEIAQDRDVHAGVEISEGEHLHVFEQAVDTLDAGQHRGDNHHRAGSVGNPRRKIEPRQSSGADHADDDPLNACHDEVARRQQYQQRYQELERRRSARVAGVDDGSRHEQGGEDRNRAEIHAGGLAEQRAPDASPRAGPIREIGFEIAATPIDQVIADVSRPVARRFTRGRLAGAFDGFECDAHLPFAAPRRQLLDRLPLLIAAQEIHARVGTRGIALEHLFDQAHRLDVLLPVEGGAEPETGDGIRHRDLGHSLTLVLVPNRVFRGGVKQRQVIVNSHADRR